MTTLADWRPAAELDLHPFLLGALDEFAIHGYDGTSVRTLARRLGVTVPALYYHYENKQAMLVTLLNEAMARIENCVSTALRGAHADPESRLRAVVDGLVQYFAYYPQLAAMDIERRSLDPSNREAYVVRRDAMENRLRQIVAEGVADGSFTTAYPDECTRAIFNMCQGISMWYRTDGPVGPREMAQRYQRLALAMLRDA